MPALDTKKYTLSQGVMSMAYVVLLITGIVIYILDFGTYGEVAYNET